MITIFYISKLKINFLFVKRLCEIKFKKNFDENDFYIRNKKKQLMLKVLICNNVYIIDKITKKLNEIIFIAIIIDKIKNIFTNNEIVLLFTKFLFTKLLITNIELNF